MKSLLLFLIQILWLLLIGHVILSWLMAAGVRNDVVVRAYAAIGQILDPFMRRCGGLSRRSVCSTSLRSSR